MKSAALQNLIHRGTVSAAGYFFAASHVGEEAIRRRVLRLWRKDVRLFRSNLGLILLFGEPVMVDCRRAPAIPLVRDGNLITSFPLRNRQRLDFASQVETIVLAVEGRIHLLRVEELTAASPAEWFDVSGFQLVETKSLGEMPAAPAVASKIEEVDLRTKLDGIPPASDELNDVLTAIRATTKGTAGKPQEPWHDIPASRPDSTFSRILGRFIGLLATRRGSSGGTSDQRNAGGFSTEPGTPGFLRKFLVRAAFFFRIGRLVGRKQARYLMKMMDMFENGDLTEALKHAVPLGAMSDLEKLSQELPSLGLLRPRSHVGLNLQRPQASGSSVFLDDQWFSDLRAMYRQTYERLVAQRRFDEAVFVLDELLNSHAEAVEFLEKHGKFRLAAELAEARNLPKETQARQWMLAGDTEKAMRIAILHDCFEYVVARLESAKNELAIDLRVLWAENLAAKGNFSAAVDVIWPLENHRPSAIEWIENVIEFGGSKAAAMLAKRISIVPSAFDEDKQRILDLARESDAEAHRRRAEFAREAVRLTPNDQLRKLARPIIRRLLADLDADGTTISESDFRAFVNFSQDYSLRADLPPAKVRSNQSKPGVFRLTVDDSAEFDSPVKDAMYLPGGKIALALGEYGVRLVSRKGATIAHFDQPTTRFIPATSRLSALCIAERGEITRIAKIDFVTRRSGYLGELKVGSFAPDFDGRVWFVAHRDTVFLVDTESDGLQSMWNVSEKDSSIFGLQRTDHFFQFWVNNGPELWRYELPTLTLRQRTSWPISMDTGGDRLYWWASGSRHLVIIGRRESSESEAMIYDSTVLKATIPFCFGNDEYAGSAIVNRNFILAKITDSDWLVKLYEYPDRLIAEISLPAENSPVAALFDRELVIRDSTGRVVIFDHQERLLLANERF